MRVGKLFVSLLPIINLLVLVTAVLFLPLRSVWAQNDTQTDQQKQEDQSKQNQKTKEEEKPVGQEQKLEEEITVTGTRAEGRSATDTPAPVDIINTDMLTSSGATETG